MHQYTDIYLLQRQTLHVSGVTAPILRSSKTSKGNCIEQTQPSGITRHADTSPNQATVEGSSGTDTMTYTRGSRYSFWNS
jgi:hypothetical protein